MSRERSLERAREVRAVIEAALLTAGFDPAKMKQRQLRRAVTQITRKVKLGHDKDLCYKWEAGSANAGYRVQLGFRDPVNDNGGEFYVDWGIEFADGEEQWTAGFVLPGHEEGDAVTHLEPAVRAFFSSYDWDDPWDLSQEQALEQLQKILEFANTLRA